MLSFELHVVFRLHALPWCSVCHWCHAHRPSCFYFLSSSMSRCGTTRCFVVFVVELVRILSKTKAVLLELV